MARSADIRLSSSGGSSRSIKPGRTFDGLAKRHGISRNLIRILATKVEAEFDDDLAAASILQECEARIGALEGLVGKLALENEFLKGLRGTIARRQSDYVRPVVSRSQKDVG